MLFDHHRQAAARRIPTRRRDGERGYIMVMFGLLLVPLLLMAGLAVDVGHWYSRTSDMRRAADAAALAGVVWLPDINAARTAALAAAARNGYVPSSTIEITVTASTQSDNRLKVTIRDKAVGSFFYSSLGGSKQDFSRTSFAEYLLAVPMGSPRNFFGTGTLLENYTATGITPEYLYQSVNPYCTDKVNGDRYQSGWFNAPTSNGNTTCATNANTEYRNTGYSMYIEAPENRTAAIDVKLYDAKYSKEAVTWQVQGEDNCVDVPVYTPATSWNGPYSSSAYVFVVGPAQYQTRSSTTGSWSSTVTIDEGTVVVRDGRLIRFRSAATVAGTWSTSSSTSNITVSGPIIYQTRPDTSTSWDTISSATYVAGGNSVTARGNRIRWKSVSINTVEQCTPTYTTVTDKLIDEFRQSGNDDYTYTLYQADNTPLNDDDNPQICQQTFTATTAYDGTEYLGSRRWNTLCQITTAMPSGRYVLRVTNSGTKVGVASSGTMNDGSNQWGLVAKYATTGDGLCDGRNDVMCPRVYGKDAISVRAATTASVASFYLAEIVPQHAGKKLKLELFDPGEGGQTIEIMKPSGTNGNTWTPATFSWKANTSPETTGTNVTSLDVTQSKFNGKLVEITIDLTGYAPPTNNDWWQIRYTFAGADVTDRTTWSARIVGDPVHLVEEY